MKKISALILALLMTLSLLVSCSEAGTKNNEDDTTASTDAPIGVVEETSDPTLDENGYLKDGLPEKMDLNDTITILMWDDYTMTEFFSTSENSDMVGDAVDARNSKVEERLGVKIEFVETHGSSTSNQQKYMSKVAADAQASPCEYDIYATYSRTPCQLTLQGYTQNLMETEYFDVEKPWWPNALIDECMINDKLFFCSGDISTNLLWMMIATFYNEGLANEYQIEKTPYDLVDSNEWVIDNMYEMVKDIYMDLDASNDKSDGDKYGFVIYETNIDAFQTAAGITAVIKDEDGNLAMSPEFANGEKQLDMISRVSALLSAEGAYHTNSINIRQIFFEQRALMITDRVFIVAGKDNSENNGRIEFSYGIVPQPKYSSDQENYVTNVGHPFTMYAINRGSHDIDASSAVLEAMGSENYRSVTPKVFEAAMKVRYASNSTASRMYDIIRENISFDVGRLYADTFGGATANMFRKAALNSSISYTTQYKKVVGTFEKALETITKAFE